MSAASSWKRHSVSDPVCLTFRWHFARSLAVVLLLMFSATAISEDAARRTLEDRGRAAFARCAGCHTIEEGAGHLIGPNLHGIFGRKIAGSVDYSYSVGLRARTGIWDEDALNRYIARPKLAAPGNNMAFPGMTSPHARRDLIEWLKTNPSHAGNPETDDFQALLAQNEVMHGAELARACMVCHTVTENAGNGIAPNLWEVIGRPIASVPDFNYSERIMRREGTWTPQALNSFFLESKAFDQGSHRAFQSLARPADRAALISWLKTLQQEGTQKAR